MVSIASVEYMEVLYVADKIGKNELLAHGDWAVESKWMLLVVTSLATDVDRYRV